VVNLSNSGAGAQDPRGRRRLEIARHAEGVDALGWALLGFVLGAAAAVAALLHADFHVQAPRETSRLIQLHTAPAAAQLALQALIRAPEPRPPPAVTAKPAAPTPAPKATTPAAGSSISMYKPAIPKSAQVDEDAAAAGMTSRPSSDVSDLY
jgi:hypothetical protein